jgi:hypothetical protein
LFQVLPADGAHDFTSVLHPIHTSQCGYPTREKGDYHWHWFNIAYLDEYKNTSNDLNDVCPEDLGLKILEYFQMCI